MATKQRQRLRSLYRIYKLYDYIPILSPIGLSSRIQNNCQHIFYGDRTDDIDELWHETFDMIYYDITGKVPKDNVTFNTAHETKIMKWQLSNLHKENNGKELTTRQWLNLFQSKVRTLPEKQGYINLMYAHWLYKQYVKSKKRGDLNVS